LKRPAGERRYFELAPDMSLSMWPQLIWLNDEKLREGFHSDATKPFRNLQFAEPPRLAFNRRKGRGRLRDACAIMLGIWLVSDRLKMLLERLDPEAVAFVQAEVDYSNFDEPGPAMWLCDIVRMLDCVDDDAGAPQQHWPGRPSAAVMPG
jgi:hypothetical protein